ncbi:metal-sensitive transcriptional regulator [Thermodesulfatator indicus]|nr:metal-sensitive transcriptional regulator [Thermodesulfatator indicus]
MKTKDSKKQLINRLKRAQGQLKALVEMIETDAPCEKTVVQFKAAKAAFDSAYALFLELALEKCLAQKDQETLKLILKHLCQIRVEGTNEEKKD